ncbi:MAG: four helix bundle protein [Bacteroidales bacterium]
MNTTSFTDLIMWQRAHSFVLEVYKVTKSFPKDEVFGLTSQFRRAAVSIAANQAEGYKRRSSLEKLRFFNISQGSLEECRYYIILSNDLGYINGEQNNVLKFKLEDASKLLNSYCTTIIQRQKKSKK